MSSILPFLLFSAVISAKLDAAVLLHTMEVVPDRIKKESINKSPLVQPPTINNEKIKWISKKSLWTWDLESNSLTFARLSDQEDLVALQEVPGSSEVYLATNTSLVKLDGDRLLQIATHKDSLGFTKALIKSSDTIYWIHDKGVWEYNLKLNALKSNPLPNLQKSDKIVTVSSSDLLLIRDRFLISYHIDSGALEVLQKGYSPFFHGMATKDHIFLSSVGGVTQLSRTGELESVLPITDERELIASDHSSTSHVYLLSDGTIEVYDLDNKNTGYFLSNLSQKKISEASISQDKDIVVLSGKTWIKAYLYSNSPSGVDDGML